MITLNRSQRQHPLSFTSPVLAIFGFIISLFCLNATAQPIVRCEITYAAKTQILESRINDDPNIDAGGAYVNDGSEIADRFRVKAILLGSGQNLEVIKLYAYYETSRQAILLQEVKYTAPFTLSTTPYGLTGLNYLYSPPLGRELQYGCALLEEHR